MPDLQQIVSVFNRSSPSRAKRFQSSSSIDAMFFKSKRARTPIGRHGRSSSSSDSPSPRKGVGLAWGSVINVGLDIENMGLSFLSSFKNKLGNGVETVDHCLVLCRDAWAIWDGVFQWWMLGPVNIYSASEIYNHQGNYSMSKKYLKIWQAIIWVTGYYIWKNRNKKVFGSKHLSVPVLFHEIQVFLYEWIIRRMSKDRFHGNSGLLIQGTVYL